MTRRKHADDAAPRSRGLMAALARFWRQRGGNVGPLMALMIVPIVAAFGMVMESGDWYLTQRAAQNAADTAALAAAASLDTAGTTCTSGTSGGFSCEALAASSKAGFTNGSSHVTVTPSLLSSSSCPAAGTYGCYKVVVQKTQPFSFMHLVGYNGTANSGSQTIQAVAVVAAGMPIDYCLIALGGAGFTLNGGPNADMPGCSLFSNGALTCHGHTMSTSPYGYAVGSSSCGNTQVSGASSITDPYGSLDANAASGGPIPNNTCGGVYAGRTITSSDFSAGTPVTVCGPATLGGNVNVTAANTVLTIFNGPLVLGANTLSTSGSGSLTIIFSGPTTTTTTAGVSANTAASPSYVHYPTGAGTIDIAAPNSGALSGIAILQDTRMTGAGDNDDMSALGNTPTFDIQGLVYMPQANITVAGAINLHTNGLQCIGFVVKSARISGTGSLLNNFNPNNVTSQCAGAGLTLPGIPNSHTRSDIALIQ